MLTALQVKFAHWDFGKQGSSWKLLSMHTEQSTQKISYSTAIGVPSPVKNCPAHLAQEKIYRHLLCAYTS